MPYVRPDWAPITDPDGYRSPLRTGDGSFVLVLKPRELYAQWQGVFSDVKEGYRVKQDVLARLRRDAELRELLGEDA